MATSLFDICPHNFGKSFATRGRLAIKQPDGTFKDIGTIEPMSTDSHPLADGLEAKQWRMDELKDLSFTCKIEQKPETIKALRKMIDDCEKSSIAGLVNMARKIGRKHWCECRNDKYRHFNHLVHKHYNMNFSRYCKSIGIRFFRGFRVRLESGCWVWKK